MSKQFLGILIGIILVFVGILTFGGKKSDAPGTSSSKASALTQHFQGKGTSGVTLVEYGDYQCPFCGEYYPTVKQVQAKYGDQIKFQFRNFPLVNIHQNAFAAARAAEAAGLQNKYWEMHDLLYQTQGQWSSSSSASSFFNQYAAQIGLNVNQFKTDYASSKVNDAINADTAEGTRLKIDGTPTFFLNGKKIQVSNSADSFSKQIDDAIAEAKR